MGRAEVDGAAAESIRHLGPDLFPSAAELLAAAFFDNPAHIYMCRDPDTRFAQLEWFLGRILRLHVETDHESSFCLAHDSVVDAMGFWTRPDAPAIGRIARLRAGMLAAPFRLGVRSFRRAIEVGSRIDRLRAETLGERPYWYLNNMVVREPLRGTGVGSRLLIDQIRIVTKRAPEAAVALATQRDENVTFYRRLGFEVASEEVIGSDAAKFRNWIMVYGAG